LEAEKVGNKEAAHDAYTRLLSRLEPSEEELWKEAEKEVEKTTGIIVLDDTTLDKPYSEKIEIVSKHWSGKHHKVVKGINLITLLWTDGDRHIPCDYRLYEKSKDKLTKNDHFANMIKGAKQRGFAPECVVFDSWYSSIENLKLIRSYNWVWLTRLKENRQVNPDRQGLQAIKEVEIGVEGREVWLEAYGLIKVFKIVATDGNIEYWATNSLHMNDLTRVKFASFAWTIENYHRGIKQFTLIEFSQVRSSRSQRNHIGLALRAFLRLEFYSFKSGLSWFEAKFSIIRSAVRAYLLNPLFSLTA
jgi:putative transposase